MAEILDFLKERRKVNLCIVFINIAVFIWFTIIGSTENVTFMFEHGAAYTPAVLGGEYYRLFTCMFLHFGIYHLVYNMLCLLYMGDFLETAVGPVRYLLIYIFGGLAGNLVSLRWDLMQDHYPVSAGASGAIFAVIGAMLYIVIRNRRQVGTEFGRRLAIMAVLSVLQGFTDVGTDNAAHIGGLAAGFLLAALLLLRKDIRSFL